MNYMVGVKEILDNVVMVSLRILQSLN